MQLSLPWRYGWTKPFGSIPRINWGHPLTRGLLTYCYDVGGPIIDLVGGGTGKIVASTTHIARSVSPFGLGLKYGATSSSDYFLMPVNRRISTFGNSVPYTIACATFYTGAPNINSVVVGPSDGSSNQGPVFWIDGTNTFFAVVLNNANTHDFAQLRTTNTFQSWVCAAPSTTTATLYANGKLDSSLSGIATTQSITGMSNIFNNGNTGSNNYSGGAGNGLVYYYAGWNRVLTAAEALLLHSDPYCFLIYPEDEIFATLVGASAAPSFTWLQMTEEALRMPKAHWVREMIRHD